MSGPIPTEPRREHRGLAASLRRLIDAGGRYIDYRTAWLAALVMGAIVWWINSGHGALAALPAALKQAAYTFLVAGFIVRLCETLAARVSPRALAMGLAVLVPSAIAVGLTFGVHSLRGTPEPAASTLPTLLMAPPSFFVWARRTRAGVESPDARGRPTARRALRWVGGGLALAAFAIGAALWVSTRACGDGTPAPAASRAPIPQCLLLPHEGLAVWWARTFDGNHPAPQYGDFTLNRPPSHEPIRHVPLSRHPFLAAGGNNMHNDAHQSDAYPARGPAGLDPRISTRTQGFGGYGTLAFDDWGRVVAVYSNGRGFQLELMDPDSLEESASYDLPGRPWYFPLQGVPPWKYIGAGMYFFLDHRGRAVVPTTRNAIEVIQTPAPDSNAGFEPVRSYDLSGHVAPQRWPGQDSVAWVLPAWDGERYWFATTSGVLGTVGVASGAVRTRRLEGEIIENAFAVGEEGVFVISDHALYLFEDDASGDPRTAWRSTYDRGPAMKPGHITRGSGSSVTLVGGRDGLVVVSDNAEPRIHVRFARRSDGETVCDVPVFRDGQSGTDLSLVAFEHADADGKPTGHYSALVENNWGHHSFPRPQAVPGITRVDARRLDDGSFSCAVVWTSGEKSIGVMKLSLGSGLIYSYGADDVADATGWYFTAIDFETGETVFRKHSGIGHGYNNWQGALFLHPDNGALYTTAIFGLVRLQDGPTRAGPADSRP